MQTLRYARTQSVVCFAHAHVHEIYMGICDSSYATAVFLVNLFKMRTCIRSYRDSMILPMPEMWIFHSLRQIEPMIRKLCQPNTNQLRNDQPAKKKWIKLLETTRKRRLNNCQRQTSVTNCNHPMNRGVSILMGISWNRCTNFVRTILIYRIIKETREKSHNELACKAWWSFKRSFY